MVSMEEFGRLQAALMEVKTEKVALQDQVNRMGPAVSRLEQQLAGATKDLAKSQKAISKSKKSKEMLGILDEHAAGVARLKAGHAQELATLRNQLAAALGSGGGGAPAALPALPPAPAPPNGGPAAAAAAAMGAAAAAEAAARSEEELGTLQAELDALQSMVPVLKAELANITETAQKRKEQLNAFAIEKHGLVDKHSAAMDAVVAQHGAAMAAQLLESTTTSQKVIAELQGSNAKHETRLATLEGRLGVADGEKDAVSSLLATRTLAVAALEASGAAAADTIAADGLKLATMQEAAEAATVKEAALQTDLDALKLEMATLAEKGNNKAIGDKKGAAMIKDLKKQLKAEQKRCSALENALDDASSGGGRGGSAAAGNGGSSPRLHRRTASSASQSSMSSNLSGLGGLGTSALRASQMSLASLTPSSHSLGSQSNLSQQSTMITVEEHTELIHKVSRMQAENAEKNEVVKHLQNRLRAIGSELVLKTELISRNLSQGLVNGGGGGGGSSSSSSKSSKTKTKMKAENLLQINTTLSNVLEETLMKNIQLEKMVEALSTPLPPSTPMAGTEDGKATRM